MQVQHYEELVVWQRAMELVKEIYTLTKKFPPEEMYGLTSQMRRCVISIPSNTAEGSRRGTRKDFRQFLIVAFGSGAELETQLKIAKMLQYISEKESAQAEQLLSEVMKMLNKMIFNMQS